MADLTRLEAHLRTVRDGGRKLLVPYVTGGLGDDWVEVVRAFAAAGADAIEIGIPFSDPVMDGPVIQQASQAALDRGTTPLSVLAAVPGLDIDVPLVLRLDGTNSAEGLGLLADAELPNLHLEKTMLGAAERVVQISRS